MTWWQAMMTVLLGNTIVLMPMCLNAHAGTKYGVSFPVLLRASFGTRGANVPAMLRAIVACGWFGIQTWIGGTAIDALLGMMFPRWNAMAATSSACGCTRGSRSSSSGLIQVYFIVTGLEGIKHLESWAAPLLLLGGVVLLWWASAKAGGLGHVLEPRRTPLQKQQAHFWAIFPAFLTGAVGYWATLDSTSPTSRATRSRRDRKSSARRSGCRRR